MTGADEGSRIRDAFRDSKILRDTPSKFDHMSDIIWRDSRRAVAGLRQHMNYGHHRVGRDVARTTKDGVTIGFHHRSYSTRESNKRWFRSNVATYSGSPIIEDLWDWIDAMEEYFEEKQPPEMLKCKLASYALEGEAESWWQCLQFNRAEEGRPKIVSWIRMKHLLARRFLHAWCSIKAPFEPYMEKRDGKEINFTGFESIIPIHGNTDSFGDEVKSNSHNTTKVHSKEETEAITTARNTLLHILEKDKMEDKGNENNEDEATSSIELKDKHISEDVGIGNVQAFSEGVGIGSVQDSLVKKVGIEREDDQFLEEEKTETYYKKGGSNHKIEVADWELPNDKHCVETVALAILDHESGKTDEKHLDKLTGAEFNDSGDQMIVMPGHLTRGDIEGHKIGAEHDANNLSVVLEGRLELSCQLRGDPAKQFLPTNPYMLDTVNPKSLVNVLVLKRSSQVIIANVQDQVANHSRGRLQGHANQNVRAFLSFDLGGMTHSLKTWNLVSRSHSYTCTLSMASRTDFEKVFYMKHGKTSILYKMGALLYDGVEEVKKQTGDLWEKVYATAFVLQTQSNPSMPKIDKVVIGMELQYHVSYYCEGYYNVRNPKLVNKMDTSAHPDGNRELTKVIFGKYKGFNGSIIEFVSFIFDPGGAPCLAIQGNFGNYLFFSFSSLLDYTILRVNVVTTLLSIRSVCAWDSCMMLKNKIAKRIVSCLCSRSGNVPDSLVHVVMVLSLKSCHRIGGRILTGYSWLSNPYGIFMAAPLMLRDIFEIHYGVVVKRFIVVLREECVVLSPSSERGKDTFGMPGATGPIVSLTKFYSKFDEVHTTSPSTCVQPFMIGEQSAKFTAVSMAGVEDIGDIEDIDPMNDHLNDLIVSYKFGSELVEFLKNLKLCIEEHAFEFWLHIGGIIAAGFQKVTSVILTLHFTHGIINTSSTKAIGIHRNGLCDNYYTCIFERGMADMDSFVIDGTPLYVHSPMHIGCYMTTLHTMCFELLEMYLLLKIHEWDARIRYDEVLKEHWHCNLSTDTGFNLTRGRVIPWDGWNDENIANMTRKFIMAETIVVIISLCMNTLWKNQQSRECLRLFYNVVNGLDPPMDLGGDCEAYESDLHATYQIPKTFNVVDLTPFHPPDDAQTREFQLEDEFVILGADGDDAVRMQKLIKLRVILSIYVIYVIEGIFVFSLY